MGGGIPAMLKSEDNATTSMLAEVSQPDTSWAGHIPTKEDSGQANGPTLTLRNLEAKALAWLEGRGYDTIPADGLLSPAFPDSFVPSAFHTRVVRGAHEGVPNGTAVRQAGCEWVYRHVDRGRVGSSPFHLSSFKMLVFFGTHDRTERDYDIRRETINTFSGLLRQFGLDSRRCLITYFSGGSIRGQRVAADDDVLRLWGESGVPKENLLPIEGGANFTNLTREGEPAGPRCEIYWPVGQGRFVEIGTVVFERYLLRPGGVGLEPSNGLVYGAALGLERLSMVAAGYDEVFAIPELRRLIETVEAGVDPRLALISRDHLLTLVDATRTLTVLWNATGGKCKGRRLERIRAIWKTISRSLQALGLDKDKERLVTLIGLAYREALGNKAAQLSDIELLISDFEGRAA